MIKLTNLRKGKITRTGIRISVFHFWDESFITHIGEKVVYLPITEQSIAVWLSNGEPLCIAHTPGIACDLCKRASVNEVCSWYLQYTPGKHPQIKERI